MPRELSPKTIDRLLSNAFDAAAFPFSPRLADMGPDSKAALRRFVRSILREAASFKQAKQSKQT